MSPHARTRTPSPAHPAKRSRLHRAARPLAGLVAALIAAPLSLAQAPTPAAPASAASAPPTCSSLDAPLFYQLLIGEMELRGGDAGSAFDVVLDAARRTKTEALFLRAIEIALQARDGERALAATQAWRVAHPAAVDAMRYQAQLLVMLNRTTEAAEPMRALIESSPPAERPALIASLPRMFARVPEQRQAASMMERVLEPYIDAPTTRTATRVSLGRTWLAAGDAPRALLLAERAARDDPGAPGPALLALEMLPTAAAAEQVVQTYLQQPNTEPAVRLAYVRLLTSTQRYMDAVTQLQQITQSHPNLAPPWLNLGALWLELREPAKADEALQKYVQLAQAGAAAPAGNDANDDDDEPAQGSDRGLVQAWLMLSQAAEQRGDYAAAESWLGRVDSPQRALEVQTRRASMLARQDKVAEARELIRRVPERGQEDARAKLLAEAHLLREVKRWGDAHQVLAQANERFAGDADLIYEQAMTAEKLNQLDDMERLLRRVIELRPEHHHAYNALGYSLADRSLRLPEARDLIRRALELSPGDPFITDSMGWVEFRMGNRGEALRHLRAAYRSRPDTEIAAHLAEVLWVDGQHDEARRILREARGKDAANEVLRETIARLKVDL
jgi:tetratricopeptide (TPR) repeat protein